MPVPLLHTLPLVVIAIVCLLTFLLAKNRSRPQQYQLGEKWTAGVVLWSAIDDIDHGHGHGHSHSEVAGKAASGEW